MLRIVHVFDIKPGVIEESFVEWLDAQLDQITRRFGCEKRKTWMFLDGIRGNYERGNPDRRPKYLNEAFLAGPGPRRGRLTNRIKSSPRPLHRKWPNYIVSWQKATARTQSGNGCFPPKGTNSAVAGSITSSITPSCAMWKAPAHGLSPTIRVAPRLAAGSFHAVHVFDDGAGEVAGP